ncbi:MAG: NTP transferase domain-containing protein [Candidatus Binataceae bacterium]|nr:NTP transferase domain-containing protein [Candidatus Binataceae bacterium]
MVTPFDGAILAAGLGERLRPAVENLPKPLVPLNQMPLLVRQAWALKKAGARSVLAIVNSETARMLDERGIGLPDFLNLMVRDTANSMESLFALGEQIKSDRFLLATVDSMVRQSELDRFSHAAVELTASGQVKPYDGVLAVVRWRGDRRPLFATVNKNGSIVALGGEASTLVTAGFYFLPRRIFEFKNQAAGARLDALRRLLALLIKEQVRFGAFEIDGAIDIDEGADLEAARALFDREAVHPAPASDDQKGS